MGKQILLMGILFFHIYNLFICYLFISFCFKVCASSWRSFYLPCFWRQSKRGQSSKISRNAGNSTIIIIVENRNRLNEILLNIRKSIYNFIYVLLQCVMVPDPQIWPTPEYTTEADLVISSLLDFKPELFGLLPFEDSSWSRFVANINVFMNKWKQLKWNYYIIASVSYRHLKLTTICSL